MSLARLALRLISVQALDGRTMAGDRIFDSIADPIDKKLSDEARLMAVVRTDDHEVANIMQRQMHVGQDACDLVIEIGIAAQSTIEVDGEAAVTLEIPHTDEGMEMTLDFMEHQIISLFTRDTNNWSKLWMMFCPRVTARVSRRAAQESPGVHFAARQIVLTCDLLGDPTPGVTLPAGSPWLMLLDALESVGEPQLVGTANVIRALIEGDEVADWRRAAFDLGVPLEIADFMGVGTVLVAGMDDRTDDPAAPANTVILDEEGDKTVEITEDDVTEI